MTPGGSTSDEGELVTKSLVELAAARLRQSILSGGVEPGERLVEEQLTRRLGISRAPLREALRLLAEQGLIEHVPRRGARVTTLSDRDATELYAVRAVLERSALAGCVTSRPGHLAGPRAALESMARGLRSGDQVAAADAHREFHVGLAELGGNRQLVLLYDQVLAKIQLYLAFCHWKPADGGAWLGRHETILRAVESGDREAAVHAAHP